MDEHDDNTAPKVLHLILDEVAAESGERYTSSGSDVTWARPHFLKRSQGNLDFDSPNNQSWYRLEDTQHRNLPRYI